jgi:iron complex outermembrane receptor protein
MPATVPVGSYILALARNALDASLIWQHAPGGVIATVEIRIFADDRDRSYAPGFWSTNLRMGWQQDCRDWQVSECLRVDNLFDRYYVDTVIVNDSISRYFEPCPGRTYAVVFTAARRN